MPRHAIPPTGPRFDVTLGHRAGQLPDLVVVATHGRVEPPPQPLPGATFRTFADVAPTAEGIRQFASQWGWLTAPQAYDSIEGYPDIRLGEPVATWADAIARVRLWVAVWEAWRAQDLDAMTRAAVQALARLDVGDVTVTDDPADWDARLTAWGRHDTVPRSDLRLADAAGLLAMGITEELRRLGATVGPVLREGPDGDGFVLEPRGHSLLAALWVQFAHALAHHHTVRPCVICGAWIEIGPGRHSKNRLLCSNRCKVQAYRQGRLGV